jgi:hypothetical protein
MSVFLDQKYLLLISNRLPFFKKKKDQVYNCRCILCGDSAKKKNKARGYFFAFKTDLMYKCYNCGASMQFGSFLKKVDTVVHSEYSLERYSEGHVKPNVKPQVTFSEPQFKKAEEKLLDKLLDRLDTLEESNEAVQYCITRKIPKEKFKQLYFIDNIANIVQLNDKYKASIKGQEPRLVLPFYDSDGQLSGVTCRALRGEALRYVTIKIKEEVPLIFGFDAIDKEKPVYVVEGPIDSLFLPNSIAVGNSDLKTVSRINLPKEKLVLVFDNQPRNAEICKLVDKAISSNYKVVIWPQTLQYKDINEIVLGGVDPLKLIQSNTFEGLTAKAKFMSWKRC